MYRIPSISDTECGDEKLFKVSIPLTHFPDVVKRHAFLTQVQPMVAVCDHSCLWTPDRWRFTPEFDDCDVEFLVPQKDGIVCPCLDRSDPAATTSDTK